MNNQIKKEVLSVPTPVIKKSSFDIDKKMKEIMKKVTGGQNG